MTEWSIMEYLLKTRDLLPPLQCDSVLTTKENLAGADGMLTTFLKGNYLEQFLFLIEVKSKSTPQTVHNAIAQIKTYHERKNDPEMHPMIVVPYLSEERLHELEEAGVSGIDLCGNGVVNIPGRLTIFRTGNENQYPESRPVSNPFQGKSAMVARAFFKEPVVLGRETIFVPKSKRFETLRELRQNVENDGITISLSQVSKAVSALEEERLIGNQGRAIYLLDPDEILERLARAWKPTIHRKISLKVSEGLKTLSRLNKRDSLKWSITGESSVGHHMPFARGGPIRVAVSDLTEAERLLEGEFEPVPNFADIELWETDEPGFFFQTEVDSQIHWASLIQTWIELRNGDPRQKDVAREVHNLIIPSHRL